MELSLESLLAVLPSEMAVHKVIFDCRFLENAGLLSVVGSGRGGGEVGVDVAFVEDILVEPEFVLHVLAVLGEELDEVEVAVRVEVLHREQLLREVPLLVFASLLVLLHRLVPVLLSAHANRSLNPARFIDHLLACLETGLVKLFALAVFTLPPGIN